MGDACTKIFDWNKRQMFANCLLLPDISMSAEEWPACLHTPASKGCTSFQPSLPSVRPPWNTVGVSGHSFHCVRTGLSGEETVNGHLEVGENICLWRHGGLVIPQWDSASHVFLCFFSLLMDFGNFLLVSFLNHLSISIFSFADEKTIYPVIIYDNWYNLSTNVILFLHLVLLIQFFFFF